MLRVFRQAVREPLWIIGAFWALALLFPFVPGLPRPEPSGLAWRQELITASLLCITFALLALHKWQSATRALRISRPELCLILPLTAFVLWSGASLLWAASSFPVFHHTLVWGAYLLFFLLMRQACARPRILCASLFVLGTVFIIICISTSIDFFGSPRSILRGFGLGEPMAVVVPLFTALALNVRRWRAALFCGATAVLAWLAMLQAFERAPFIAASAGLVLLAAAAIASPRFRPRGVRRTVVLASVFFAVTVLQTMPTPIAFALTRGRPMVFGRVASISTADPNTNVRLLWWQLALGMARKHPIAGVGANNYDVAFSDARAEFAANHPDSPLIELTEGFLTVRAHNEYLQILAELGATGLILFLAFSVALVWFACRALCYARSPLVPGAIGSLLAFAISSGASSISFRWMGSGLLFFFAAALVTSFASNGAQPEWQRRSIAPVFVSRLSVASFAFALVMVCVMGAQGLNVIMHGMAQASKNTVEADRDYRAALSWNPYEAAAQYNYGTWLFNNRRPAEAAPHLLYGVERGYNTSIAYAYLAAAEAGAGDRGKAEATLAYAVKVYPRSVFARVRHASALADIGNTAEAEREYTAALSINEYMARGWWQLIRFGKNAATAAKDSHTATPGELLPSDGALLTVAETAMHIGANSSPETQILQANVR